MNINKSKIGKEQEEVALKFLKDKGYKILHKNYTCKIGEIDIIAEKKDTIIFIEVKYRKSDYFGLPREAVNYYKQQKIRQVATFYLKWNKSLNTKCQFDVVEILGDKITHIENCF